MPSMVTSHCTWHKSRLLSMVYEDPYDSACSLLSILILSHSAHCLFLCSHTVLLNSQKVAKLSPTSSLSTGKSTSSPTCKSWYPTPSHPSGFSLSFTDPEELTLRLVCKLASAVSLFQKILLFFSKDFSEF